MNVVGVERRERAWTVTVDSRQPTFCPGCGAQSKSRHSTYWRTLWDLSAQGAPVVVNARLGRWRCRNQLCDRRIFTERVPGLLTVRASDRPPGGNCPADWLQRWRTALGATDEAAWDAGQRHDDPGWPEEVRGGSVRNRRLSLLSVWLALTTGRGGRAPTTGRSSLTWSVVKWWTCWRIVRRRPRQIGSGITRTWTWSAATVLASMRRPRVRAHRRRGRSPTAFI